MGFFEDLSKSLSESAKAFGIQLQTELEKAEYSEHGKETAVYTPVEQDIDAIQYQPNGDKDNTLDVFAFLLDHKQPFALCSHMHIHLSFHHGEQIEEVRDGDWIVSSTEENGEFDVDILGNKDFVRDFGLKKNDPIEEEGGAGFRGTVKNGPRFKPGFDLSGDEDEDDDEL